MLGSVTEIKKWETFLQSGASCSCSSVTLHKLRREIYSKLSEFLQTNPTPLGTVTGSSSRGPAAACTLLYRTSDPRTGARATPTPGVCVCVSARGLKCVLSSGAAVTLWCKDLFNRRLSSISNAGLEKVFLRFRSSASLTFYLGPLLLSFSVMWGDFPCWPLTFIHTHILALFIFHPLSV